MVVPRRNHSKQACRPFKGPASTAVTCIQTCAARSKQLFYQLGMLALSGLGRWYGCWCGLCPDRWALALCMPFRFLLSLLCVLGGSTVPAGCRRVAGHCTWDRVGIAGALNSSAGCRRRGVVFEPAGCFRSLLSAFGRLVMYTDPLKTQMLAHLHLTCCKVQAA